MSLKRIIRNVVSLLFSGYAARKARREKAEILSLEQQLFPERKIKAVFPHLKARKQMESGKWIVWADVRTDACMLLNILPDISRAVTKYKPDRILTTVPINRKSSLILIEYLYPFRIRLSLSGKEEVLFAKAVVRSGGHAGNVLDFYMELHTMQKNSVMS